METTVDRIGRAYGDWRDNQAAVWRVYPSARVERRGLTFVAIMAVTHANGKRRDNLIGSGSTDAKAWQQAVQRVREDAETNHSSTTPSGGGERP